MKKSLTMISSLFVLSTILVACNTDTAEPADISANEPTQTESVKEEVKEDASSETTTTTASTPTPNTEQSEEKPAAQQEKPEEATLTFTSNGKPFTEDVTVTTSEELNYSISHLTNYTLEAEEPGIDHLFNNENDSLSMQIKVSSTEETNFDSVKATVLETISVIAPEGKYTELDLSAVPTKHTDIKNIVGYETLIDGEKVVMVTFERENKLVTLTIYDTLEADLTDAFLQMGLTIQ